MDKVRVLVDHYPSLKLWIAQVIEHDLRAQATSLAALLPEIQRVIVAHVVTCTEQGLTPFQGSLGAQAMADAFEHSSIRLEWLPGMLTTPGVQVPPIELRVVA